jgi:rod shape-determining protein MreC
MERIFIFIYQYRAFFTFLVLEVLCVWMVVSNNQYQSASFFNSSNSLVGNINTFSQGVREYFSLRDVNAVLAEENVALRRQVEQQHQLLLALDSTYAVDSTLINRFDFISAKVVNNSTRQFKNYITINRGRDAGIQPGMAVISPEGVVGKVKATSEHFSVVSSLLHTDLMVSGFIKRNGYFGTVQWKGTNANYVSLDYIPRHVKPLVGDTVLTSGYSGVFPEGIIIGTLAEVNLSEEAPFYDLQVKLSQDFRRLSFVVVVKSNLKHELDSLEQVIPDMKR